LAEYSKNCVVDGTPFTSKRKDKLTCSPACQKKLQRGGFTVTQELGPEQSESFLEEEATTPQAIPQPESQNTDLELNSRPVYEHAECDAFILAGQLDEACAGCRGEKEKSEPKAPMSINSDLLKDRKDRIERLNARLRAKGLPMVVPDDWHDSFLPTGIPELDALTKNQDAAGIGGLPRGKITEIFGYKGSGKSSLIKLIMLAYPQHRVLFFDAEGGLNSPP
jgi:hypothetical protein